MHPAEPVQHRSRSPHEDREKIPRVLLRALLAVVVLSLALVSYARLTDRPLEAMPKDGPVAQERILYIDSAFSGAVTVRDEHGGLVADLGPEAGGFISGVGRALERERAKSGLPNDTPIRLVRYTDGRLALHDPSSGWRVELMGFGRDNAAAFARLLALD